MNVSFLGKSSNSERGAAGEGGRSTPALRLRRDDVRALAMEVGFTEAGLVALPYAEEQRDAARFERWVEAGRAGTMKYLARVNSEREGEDGKLVRSRVGIPFPWARSAIVCFANYQSAQPLSIEPAEQGSGWIARYAWSSKLEAGRKGASARRRPSDYHKVLLKRLKRLEARIREARIGEQPGGFEARGYVDTGPVVERALATAAGLGWTGKNTCLIHPKLGSFGFLAVLLTSLEVEEARAPLTVPDRCGSCRRCLDACPTGALIEPHQMDATRCISYLTIEHKGAIGEELMSGMGRQVFGCDICQDVCPWNRKAPISADAELEARAELVNPALEWLAELTEAEFERQFNGSPVRRAGYLALRRNVAIAMGNSGLVRYRERLGEWAEVADDGLQRAARWARDRLSLKD